MQVVNVHKRKIKQPIENVSVLFNTIATNKDAIWPVKNWPAIRFNEGVKVKSKGGHGIIKYTIIAFEEGKSITFKFTKPDGFIGIHQLFLEIVSEKETEIIHEIRMHTSTFRASILWFFVIKWLHDALIEEAFDNVENHFMEVKKIPRYNIWVQFLRNRYKRKPLLTKQV
ncbi:hypothetical protein Q4512_11305 [Oceanihabitans sp. 2_MG-2023]|uniref:hypothetical protein n=1 Tax=Oceanihabitans sp. 2_MG-2023 TaxID=3062661 RepID=UPI0026E1409D|nr:hypothetical protein [Oceanihabitans sp. 2_MG-2023]MDO6597504.1 hypothetical protein [Oceanihabitans sp. 2_MG-2023]